MGYGYLLGVSAVTLGPIAIDFEDVFAGKDAFASAFLLGIVSSAGLLGGYFGAMAGGKLCSVFGRKLVMLFVALIGLLGTVLSATMPLFYLLIVARGITGVSAGLATVVCPLYVRERAPDKSRGALSTLFQTGIQSGILVSYCVGLLILNITETSPWRWIYGVCALIYVVHIALFVIMPESEVWLESRREKRKSKKGNLVASEDESTRITEKELEIINHRKTVDESLDTREHTQTQEPQDYERNLREENVEASPENQGKDFSFQVMSLQSSADTTSTTSSDTLSVSPLPQTQQKKKHKTLDTLKLVFELENIQRMLLGILLCLDFQFTGVNALVFFSTTILKEAFPEGNGAIIAAVCIGAWNVMSTIIGALLVERLGRRPLILIGMVLKTISMTGLGVVFRYMSGVALGFVALGFMAMFYFGFAVGVGGLLYLVLNELNWPERIRENMVAMLMSVMWIGSLILVLLFLPLSEAVGTSWMFNIFAIISAVSVVLLYFSLHETKSRSKAIIADIEKQEGEAEKKVHTNEEIGDEREGVLAEIECRDDQEEEEEEKQLHEEEKQLHESEKEEEKLDPEISDEQKQEPDHEHVTLDQEGDHENEEGCTPMDQDELKQEPQDEQ